MRSIDDIIDKFDTSSSSVDRAAADSQSATVTSSLHQQSADAAKHNDDNVDTLRANATPDGRPPPLHVSSAGEALPQYRTAVPRDDRRETTASGSFPAVPTVRRVDWTPETAVTRDSEEHLWTMFGAPLSQLCQRLLTDFVPPLTRQRREAKSAQPRTTDTDVSSNLRPSGVEVQTAAALTAEPLGAGPAGVNRRQSHTDAGQKPPLPTKPSLPPKPTIAKKPSFGKETSVVRKSSPVCSPSSTQQQQQRLTSSASSSQQSGGVCTDDALVTVTCSSAPTSPIVRGVERDAKQQQRHQHQQQQQQVMVHRSASSSSTPTSTRTRSADHTAPPPPAVKTSSGEHRSSPARDDRTMKTTKSEEFLARIHRRSVSPVGTPRLLTRGTRGRSVDLTAAASDTPATIGRRTLSKEWAVVTTTTHEEVTVVYRPPPADTVRADALTVASSTAGVVEAQDTVNNNTVDGSGGKLYKTAIDNIRLSVGTTKLRDSGSGDGDASLSSRRTVGVGSGSIDVGGASGQSVTSPGCQLDQLISSLIEMSVDVDDVQQQQQQPSSSLRHGVVFTAHY